MNWWHLAVLFVGLGETVIGWVRLRREFGALSLFWIQDQIRRSWFGFTYDYRCHFFHWISLLCFVCNSCLFTLEGTRGYEILKFFVSFFNLMGFLRFLFLFFLLTFCDIFLSSNTVLHEGGVRRSLFSKKVWSLSNFSLHLLRFDTFTNRLIILLLLLIFYSTSCFHHSSAWRWLCYILQSLTCFVPPIFNLKSKKKKFIPKKFPRIAF